MRCSGLVIGLLIAMYIRLLVLQHKAAPEFEPQLKGAPRRIIIHPHATPEATAFVVEVAKTEAAKTEASGGNSTSGNWTAARSLTEGTEGTWAEPRGEDERGEEERGV
ncbi:hypothetical protein BV25DRAFT_1843426 [Artomyces pyxidatus]|uniref:Uncharacterized protein n=1 Tax=Artomyces pyxidatus TaxID=48021 RepID=A0ACB8SEY9_9AGAM|nr:hypothetical protein BV25DRAFT_1843426 [Artomyces pyxidatus]